MGLTSLDYYGLMKRLYRLALVPLAILAVCVHAQSPATPEAAPNEVSALDGELFYQLLIGELNARSGEAGTGYSLILDAARKTNDAKLYQRAADIALQARSGDSALEAARAWRLAQPQAREANRYVLQILIALNRVPESMEPLKNEIALAPAGDRVAAVGSIPRNYARVTDKKQAAVVVETALGDYLRDTRQPALAAAVWITIGRLRMPARASRLAGQDPEGAMRMQWVATFFHGSVVVRFQQSLRSFLCAWHANERMNATLFSL